MDPKLKKKLQEILGILSVLASLFLLLSLISHRQWDPSLLTYSASKAGNWGGVVGSYLSDTLFNAVGISAYCVPLGLVFFGINRIMGRKGYRVKLIALLLLMLAVSIFMSRIDRSFGFRFDTATTGLVGIAIDSFLSKFISIPGTYIFSLSVLLSSLILLVPETVESMVHKMKEEDRKKTRSVKKEKPEMIEDPIIQPESFTIVEPSQRKKKAVTQASIPPKQTQGAYTFPSLDLLHSYDSSDSRPDRDQLRRMSEVLKQSLEDFSIQGTITEAHPGPVITMFEFEPAAGTKMNKVISLSEDIGRAMGGRAIRIARIPNKTAIGIEIPNNNRAIVSLRDILEHGSFIKSPSKLTLAVGVNTNGTPVIADLIRMPHLLVAGTTGSGKSVCLNTMVTSILYKASPDDVKMLMIDPKMIELSAYDNIPHLIHPVITHPKEATEGLRKMVFEMERRYRMIAEMGAKNIESYNRMVSAEQKLPFIVIVIDELADLMFTASSEAEAAIVRLAQMARAAGMHLIIATQRPSVDVITGIIKANFPTRIAFRVTSKIDSRTILDTNGAEQLLDKGDMLMLLPGARMDRLHGAYISEEEIKNVTAFVRRQLSPDFTLFDSIETEMAVTEQQEIEDDRDDLYQTIIGYAESTGEISISSIQRKFKIGYNRAARIMDMLEEDGMVGPPRGAGKPRDFIGRRSY